MLGLYDVDGQLSLFGPDGCSGKTCREPSPAEIPRGRTSGSSWRKPREWWTQPAMCLDLRRDSGLVLGIFWQTVFPSHGGQSTHNFWSAPKTQKNRACRGFCRALRPGGTIYRRRPAGVLSRGPKPGGSLCPKPCCGRLKSKEIWLHPASQWNYPRRSPVTRGMRCEIYTTYPRH